MKALVLSGGSVKGAFQAGAISVVLEKDFEPDLIYGVSVGALNGAFLADRAGGRVAAKLEPEWQEIGQELTDFWTTNIKSFKDIGKKRSGFGLFLRILRKRFTGLLKMGPLTELLRRTLSAERINDSTATFHAGVVDLASGEFFNATYGTQRRDLVEFVIASTREPIKMPIHWFKTKPPGGGEVIELPLVDGGVRNIAPLGEAIDKGALEIVVIACQPETIKPAGDDTNYRDFFDVASRTVGIMTNEIVNNDLKVAEQVNQYCLQHGDPKNGFMVGDDDAKHAGHRYIPITIIRPEKPIKVSITGFNSDDIKRMIQQGRERAEKDLEAEKQSRTELLAEATANANKENGPDRAAGTVPDQPPA